MILPKEIPKEIPLTGQSGLMAGAAQPTLVQQQLVQSCQPIPTLSITIVTQHCPTKHSPLGRSSQENPVIQPGESSAALFHPIQSNPALSSAVEFDPCHQAPPQ